MTPALDRIMYGASMAAPHVAAAAALLLKRYPTWSRSQILSRLHSTAQDLGSFGHDDVYGYGFLRADVAVAWSAEIDGPHSVDPNEQESWSVTVDAGQPPFSYQWYVDDVPSGTSSQLTITTPSDNFIIDVEVTDDTGAETGDSRIVIVCSGSGPCMN